MPHFAVQVRAGLGVADRCIAELGRFLGLRGKPRDQNEEADALTIGDYSQFRSTSRVNLVVEEVALLVPPRMRQRGPAAQGIA